MAHFLKKKKKFSFKKLNLFTVQWPVLKKVDRRLYITADSTIAIRRIVGIDFLSFF